MLWYEDERDAEWVVDKLEGACGRRRRRGRLVFVSDTARGARLDVERDTTRCTGFMFADKPLRLSLFRRPPPSVAQASSLRSAPPSAPAARGRAAKLRMCVVGAALRSRRVALTARAPRRSVDLRNEAWERAVAAASAAAPATYAGTFKDDFGKLAGVIQYAHMVRRPTQKYGPKAHRRSMGSLPAMLHRLTSP